MPEFRAHPKVLAVRLDIYWDAKNWEVVVNIAGDLATLEPKNAHAWIGRSFALHELKWTQEAHDLLLPAKDKFPKNSTIPYNLACYCAQLNRLIVPNHITSDRFLKIKPWLPTTMPWHLIGIFVGCYLEIPNGREFLG
jgi:hypothetical protein